jgi:hypothetical protein
MSSNYARTSKISMHLEIPPTADWSGPKASALCAKSPVRVLSPGQAVFMLSLSVLGGEDGEGTSKDANDVPGVVGAESSLGGSVDGRSGVWPLEERWEDFFIRRFSLSSMTISGQGDTEQTVLGAQANHVFGSFCETVSSLRVRM